MKWQGKSKLALNWFLVLDNYSISIFVDVQDKIFKMFLCCYCILAENWFGLQGESGWEGDKGWGGGRRLPVEYFKGPLSH